MLLDWGDVMLYAPYITRCSAKLHLDGGNKRSPIGHPKLQGCLQLRMTPEFQHSHLMLTQSLFFPSSLFLSTHKQKPRRLKPCTSTLILSMSSTGLPGTNSPQPLDSSANFNILAHLPLRAQWTITISFQRFRR